ncbi:MAG: cell division protein FtsQ/DivIB [Porticoccaceae bacterium]
MSAARRFQGARPHARERRVDIGRLLQVAGFTLVLAAALTVLVAAGVVLYRYLDAPLRVVAVDGDIHHLRRAEIEDLVSQYLDGGFLTLDMRGLQRGLEEHPWIASVRARREWPNGLYLHIDEEAPIARWRAGEFINGRGEVLPGVSADDFKELPELVGPENSEADVMAAYHALTERLAGTGLRIEWFARDDEGLRLRFSGGTELILGRADTDARVERFLVLWRKGLAARRDELARVDARYGNGVAVRWRAAPAATHAG